MALDNSALLELLGQLKLTDVSDRVRVATETLYQELIDAEAAAFIGAGPYERSTDRVTQRNGVRQRLLSTTAGDLQLKIPKLRAGTFFPSLLERRRRVDQALFAVVMEAYLHGVSTRKVDDLSSKRSALTPGYRSLRCHAFALTSTPRLLRSVTVTLPGNGTRTCSSTRPIAKPASIIGVVSQANRGRGRCRS